MTQPNDAFGEGETSDDAIGTAQPLVDVLKQLSELPGPSGQESAVAARIEDFLAPHCDDVTRDDFDNVIAVAKGNRNAAESNAKRPKMMFAAHSDEIGLIVTKIDEGGFLRFTSVGGIDPRAIVAQQVVVLAGEPLPGFIGVKPPHILTAEDRKTVPAVADMFIDVGLPEDVVRERIRPGAMVVLQRQFTELLGGRVAGKALDNRAGVAAMIESMRLLKGLKHAADVYAVATVQEEVGYRGAIVSAYDIVPDMAIAIDVGFGEAPGVAEGQAIGMGKGPSIAIGANVHPRLHRILVDAATEHGIPHQIEPMPGRSGTDGWALQVVRSGIPTAVVSIPLRSMHTSVEIVDVEDVRNTGRLLAHAAAALTEADAEGWGYALT